MNTKSKAIEYWQDRLAKFFPTSKGPSTVEVDMFVEGYRQAKEESLRRVGGEVKFKPKAHITGKVYDLTQENMTAMIREIDRLSQENARLREALEYIAKGYTLKFESMALDNFVEVARAALEGSYE